MAKKFRIPGLQVPTTADGEMLAFMNAVKERLELMGGERGDPEQRTVSLRELKDAGVAGVRTTNQFARLVAPRAPAPTENPTQEVEELDLSLLPQANLAEASGDLQFLLQGTTTNDRFRLLLGDMLAIFGRLDQESAPQFPWSWEAEDYGFDITGPAPRFRFVEQPEGDDDEATLPNDSAIWDSIANTGVFEFRLRADDDESGNTVWSAGRTGLNPDFFNVHADVLGIPVDGSELQLGASGDLRLFHDGANSYVRNDTGTLVFMAGEDISALYDDSGVWLFTATPIVPPNSWTNAELAQMAEATIKGRAAGAGTGDPTDLTGAEVAAIIGSAPASATYLTEGDETGDLPNSRQLLAGANVNFDDTTTGQRTINVTGGGAGSQLFSRGATWVSSSGVLSASVNSVYVRIPLTCTITKVTLLTAGGTGSCVVDVRKGNYAGFPTTASIAATAKPTISSGVKYEDSTLTGWTTSVSAGDIIEFVVESTSTFTQLSIELELQP